MQLPDSVSDWFRILPLSKIQFRKVRSTFSHFVRKDTSHLSKTISGLFGQYDYSILDNKKILFLLSIFYLIKWSREELPRPWATGSSQKHGNHGAPPLLSKIMPKHDEDWGDIKQKKLEGSWG